MNPLVSVIVPNYNYAHLIEETILSIMNQTYTNFECIIVDDGSTDESVSLISAFIKDDQRFKLLSKTNGGLPSTRNEGMKISKGKYFAFLDADDLWLPTKLEIQVNLLEKSVGDVVFSNCIFFNDQGDLGTSVFKDTKLDVYDFLGGNPIPGCSSSFILSKKVFEAVGYFNNDLRSSEDLDYLFRIKHLGFNFECDNQIQVKIRKHPAGMQGNHVRMFYNKQYCFDRSLELLLTDGAKIEKTKFNNAILIRFQSMLWTARDAKREDLVKYTYLRTRQLLGFKFYFTKSFFTNKKYDLIQKCSRFKNQL